MHTSTANPIIGSVILGQQHKRLDPLQFWAEFPEPGAEYGMTMELYLKPGKKVEINK